MKSKFFKKLSKLLVILDIFGVPVTLSVKQKNHYKTWVGGFASMMLLAFVSFLTI